MKNSLSVKAAWFIILIILSANVMAWVEIQPENPITQQELTCATDDDNPESLEYTWIRTRDHNTVTLVNEELGEMTLDSRFTQTADTIRCEVDIPHGGPFGDDETEIEENDDPEVTELSAEPDEVYRGDVFTISCTGTDNQAETAEDLTATVWYRIPGNNEWILVEDEGDYDYNEDNNAWEVDIETGLSDDWLAREDNIVDIRCELDDGFEGENTETEWNVVNVLNNHPEINDELNEMYVDEEQTINLALTGYADDVEDDSEDLEWTLDSDTVNQDYPYTISLNDNVLTITSDEQILQDYTDEIRLIVEDTDEGTDEVLVDINLVSENDIPEIGENDLSVSDDEIYRTESFNIECTGEDPDTDLEDMIVTLEYRWPTGGWQEVGEDDLEFNDNQWTGTVTTDEDDHWLTIDGDFQDTVDVQCTFNDGDNEVSRAFNDAVEVLNNLPEVDDDFPDVLAVDEADLLIRRLGDLVSDVEDGNSLNWHVDEDSINDDAPYTIEIVDWYGYQNTLVITAPEDIDSVYNDIIRLVVEDSDDGTDHVTTTVRVNPLNDAPAVDDIPDIEIDEDESDNSIDLDDYVFDVDNTDNQIRWTVEPANDDISVIINNITKVVTIIPDEDWNGELSFTFTATDPGDLSDSDDMTVTVTNDNTDWLVEELDSQEVLEDSALGDETEDVYADIDQACESGAVQIFSYEADENDYYELDMSEDGTTVIITQMQENYNDDGLTVTMSCVNEEEQTSQEMDFILTITNDNVDWQALEPQTVEEDSANGDEGVIAYTQEEGTISDLCESGNVEIESYEADDNGVYQLYMEDTNLMINNMQLDYNDEPDGLAVTMSCINQELETRQESGFTLTITDDNADWLVEDLDPQAVDEDSANGEESVDVYQNIADDCEADTVSIVSYAADENGYYELGMSEDGATVVINNMQENYNDEGLPVTIACGDDGEQKDFTLTINAVEDPAGWTAELVNQAVDEDSEDSTIAYENIGALCIDPDTGERAVIEITNYDSANYQLDMNEDNLEISGLTSNYNDEGLEITMGCGSNDEIEEATFTLTITSVNDLPVVTDIIGYDEENANQGDITFTAEVEDLDLPDDEIINVTFEVNYTGEWILAGYDEDTESPWEALWQSHPEIMFYEEDIYVRARAHDLTEWGPYIVEGPFSVNNSELNFVNITSLECFERVVVDQNQSCSVYVELNNEAPVGEATVTIYYEGTDEVFGTCITDRITGGCEAKDLMTETGNYSVYAVAEFDSVTPDNDHEPSFDFEVIEQRYEITELYVYNDSNYENEDYDFYRNEDMYVRFMIMDLLTNEPAEDAITASELVSPPGGRAELSEFRDDEEGWYYYALEPIPPTHDFLGESQAFAFTFNYVDETGGQIQVSLTIRNNLPEITPEIDALETNNATEITVDLSDYEFDIEDSGDALSWSVENNNPAMFDAVIVAKVLIITPLGPIGDGSVTVTLADLDRDTISQEITVTINEAPVHDVALVNTVIPADVIEMNTLVFRSAVNNNGNHVESTILRFYIDGDEQEDCRQEMNNLQPGETTEQYSCSWTTTHDDLGMHTARIEVDAVNEEINEQNNFIECQFEVEMLPDIGARIKADPETGKAPLRVEFIGEAVDGFGNVVEYEWTFGDGISGKQYGNNIVHVYEKKGSYTVTLKVTDSLGRTATASKVMKIDPENKDYIARRRVHLGNIQVAADPYFEAGDQVPIMINFENTGVSNIEDVKVVVGIPELGIRRSAGPFDVDINKDAHRTLLLELPEYTEPGEYIIRVLIEHDEFKRIKHRFITVI